MTRPRTPKQFSAYLVTWSDADGIEPGKLLIDKGNRLERVWDFINFDTNAETSAVGRRLTLLCADCKVGHSRLGVLGHDGECGSDDVKDEALQVIADAKKRIGEAS